MQHLLASLASTTCRFSQSALCIAHWPLVTMWTSFAPSNATSKLARLKKRSPVVTSIPQYTEQASQEKARMLLSKIYHFAMTDKSSLVSQLDHSSNTFSFRGHTTVDDELKPTLNGHYEQLEEFSASLQYFSSGEPGEHCKQWMRWHGIKDETRVFGGSLQSDQGGDALCTMVWVPDEKRWSELIWDAAGRWIAATDERSMRA